MTLAAVIFDWAGTIVDFGSRAPVVAMRQGFAAEGVALTDAEIRSGMGLPKRDHVVAIFSHARVAQAWRAARGDAAGPADIDRIYQALEPLMRAAGAEHGALVPGAAETVAMLRGRGIKIGSTTGYTRAMMGPILEVAAAQGYRPDTVVCAGETPVGRPSPLMIWKALLDLGAWPASAVVKVDDAPAGIAEGRNAGCFTVGVAASGNCMGLDYQTYAALDPDLRAVRLAGARAELLAAGADIVIDTAADLPAALSAYGWM